MLREIFRATSGDVKIKLPKNYLNKVIEVLIFPVSEDVEKKKSSKRNSEKKLDFSQVKIPTKNWKFNRTEIYED